MFLLQRLSTIKTMSVAAALIVSIITCKIVLKPQGCTILYDNRISPHMRSLLATKIDYKTLRSKSAQTLVQELKKVGTGVTTITINYQGSRTALVFIAAMKPFIKIVLLPHTTELILTHEGLLVEKEFFNTVFLEKLPTITCTQNKINYVEQELLRSFLKVPLDIFKRYSVCWHSRNLIELKSQTGQLVIIAHADNIANSKLIAQVERIAASKRYEKKGLQADIRFRDFIICKAFRGGLHEEKNGNGYVARGA